MVGRQSESCVPGTRQCRRPSARGARNRTYCRPAGWIRSTRRTGPRGPAEKNIFFPMKRNKGLEIRRASLQSTLLALTDCLTFPSGCNAINSGL